MITRSNGRTLDEIRVENLRLLHHHYSTTGDKSGWIAMARELGRRSTSFFSQMGSTTPVRRITEKTADMIERGLRLPPGWMSRENDPYAPVPIGQRGSDLPVAPTATEQSPGHNRASPVSINEAEIAAIEFVESTSRKHDLHLSPLESFKFISLIRDDIKQTGALRGDFWSEWFEFIARMLANRSS